jgi:riboflavin kinase/FMN adenylyltransferase
MKIIDGIERIKKRYPYPVLTIGNFDGVHLGHQAIFNSLVRRAKEKDGTSVVFTFEPHPLRVIAPERAPKLLTTYGEKVRLVKSFGIDLLICANFTKEFARIRAEDIVRDILSETIGVREILIGANFLFGKDRKGSPELLKRLGKKYGFRVTVLPEMKSGSSALSSSRIRKLIAKGRVKDASVLLGRNYSVEGVVIEGAKRGKTLLNVPTANIATNNELFPGDGVYAVTVDLGKHKYGGAANLGQNPTFGEKKFSFEVHILGLNRDILGDTLRVRFIERIRDEIKFDNVTELATQMRKDIDQVQEIVKKQMNK